MTKRVAIISCSYRFPGAELGGFWQNLLAGRNVVTEAAPDRWARESFVHPRKNHPGSSYTFAAGSIGEIAEFDAHFFGISPREAAFMDPQQRLLLEMSWEALENGGIRPSSLRGSQCGVFIGIASADYSYRLADDLPVIDASAATGNTASIAANRISYVLDLCGPSMAIDTACSSSMVAFHQACCSILSGESVQALTGGVSLHLHPYGFIIFSKASMLSRRGRCGVFDGAADGYVRAEGGGMFFLKDYDQAIIEGDPILAVVAGTAVNADGRKSGLTVPSPRRQAALLEHVYAKVGIDPSAIDYLEAHGTGTAVGDPAEAQAIGRALGKHRASGDPLPIGSVKGNLGHLEAASGVAGLVKALHCLRHRVIPATIGLETGNPNIDFHALNIEVVVRNRALSQNGALVVGVNSFGFGGANAHVILQSHPQPAHVHVPVATSCDAIAPLLLSARDQNALRQSADELANFIDRQPQATLSDIAANAAFRRDWHPHRAVFPGMGRAALIRQLRAFASEDGEHQAHAGIALDEPSGPAFIYSGNGSQWEGMGERLLVESSVFRDAVLEIDAFFQPRADYSLVEELAGRNGKGLRYQQTERAQPALFAVQVGLTRMLRDLGVEPVAVAGHSVGEAAAAWAAGILTLEAAVEVIFHRSRLQGTTRGKGQMTAVGMGQPAVSALLAELDLAGSLDIAGVNSSRGVTIAGDPLLLSQLEAELRHREVFHRRLDLDYAFHSPAMDSIESGLKESLLGLAPVAARLPFYSSVTGAEANGPELDAEYWWRNIRRPVLFESAIKQLQASGVNIFIEIGPHAVLRSYLNDCVKDGGSEGRIFATLKRGDDAPERVWAACAQALTAGARIDRARLFPQSGQFLQLPNYPWQRQRHWHPMTSEAHGTLERRKIHPLLGYSLPRETNTWENQVDVQSMPTFADHVVGDAAVFPGTGFVELALAAALAWLPGERAEIEDLEIRTPLLFANEHSVALRLRIEEQDGTVRIMGREYAGTAPWTLHAVARILREPSGMRLNAAAPVLPVRQPDFNAASHRGLTQAAGLAYGPAFQCVEYGWAEKNAVLAVLRTPDCIAAEAAQMHLHPALLDCAFQLIIQLLREQVELHDGETFVPVRMGRIVFRKSSNLPRHAVATLLRRTAQSLSADFTLFDGNGVVVAVVKEARFRRVQLRKSPADRLRFLEYHFVPRPLAECAGESVALIPYEKAHAAFADMVRRLAVSGSHRRFTQEVDPLLESLCSQWTKEALQQLTVDGQRLTRQKLQVCETANPDAKPFFEYLLSLALEDQSLVPVADGWEVLRVQDDRTSAQDIWNSLVADYPDYFPLIHAVGRIGIHLAEIVERGWPEQTWGRRISTSAVTCQVLGGDGKQKIGQTLRRLIDQGLRQLPEGERLRVVEVGRHLPYYAGDVGLVMDFSCCDYFFAGTSAALAEDARQLKERFSHVVVHCLEESTESGSPVPVCQLAVVTLDFETLAEAVKALDYARSCLTPGGTLVVIGAHPARWIDFICGGQPGGQNGSPAGAWRTNQHSAKFWRRQLEQLQLSDVSLLEFSPDTLSGPFLLLARPAEDVLPTHAPVKSLPRSWIVLADAHGHSAQLADHLAAGLQAKGDLVVLVRPDAAPSLSDLLLETTANYGRLDGIAHLVGLAPGSNNAAARDVLDGQAIRCLWAADILQACEATGTQTTCWLITAGVATEALPLRPSAARADANVLSGDAALWGFGRTLMNESSEMSVRMIDLESPESFEIAAEAMVREFDQEDGEQEIFLTGRGKRYAPRLRLAPRFVAPFRSERVEDSNVVLGFSAPGKLSNLRWELRPEAVLTANEVEVEVRATGLNFRDLMFTLGLLSDEAIENGFAGPTLGLEFAGVVRRVGSADCAFAPGDKVVGFGPSCFAHRVTTTASAVTHLPSGISFEAAATIPCTFFTVYYALGHLARLQPGEKVLIHCAAGGVGIAAVQVAKWIGAEIFVTAGSAEKRDFLRLLGVDHIFDSRSLAYADQIMAATGGQGIDVVLNSLAGDAIHRNLQILKPFGRFLELGKRDFYENNTVGLRPFRNNISYFGIDTDQLMQARPELTRQLFAEVMDLFNEGVLHPLPYQVFEAEDIVDAFRYMQQARHIGKIVVAYRNGATLAPPPQPPPRKPLVLSADASYLVTGGLGGFGLRTAQWLVEKGARSLVLISRSGPSSDEAQNAIAEMRQRGVQVLAASCDVTDRKALAALLTSLGETMPPLRGIVHAATVINDGLIRSMDEQQLRSVLEPKGLGAYHLHSLTLGKPLDYFILFSSATTLFGNPGQGAYVAANVCLEALARNRRAAGLPATCIRWGAIDDVGFLARNPKIKEALQGRMGGAALDSATAFDVLEDMLIADRSGVGVMEVDWRMLSRFLPSSGSPKFVELFETMGESDRVDDDGDVVQRMLEELSDADLLQACTDMLKNDVGEILCMNPEKLDPNRSLYDMGLDSLMGVELVGAVESRFGVRLPVMMLSRSPMIGKLAEHVVDQLKSGDPADAISEEQEMLIQVRQLADLHGSEASTASLTALAKDVKESENLPNGRIIH